MIKTIAFFVYPVLDVPRARQFYEETLGLVPTANYKDEWVEYDTKDGTFAITTLLENRIPGVRGGMVAFEVEDIKNIVEKLKARGVPFFQEPFETPVCRMACISDPDGNGILLHMIK